MPHVRALITIAMQLTCVVDKEILCTDNGSMAQLLNVPSCERTRLRRSLVTHLLARCNATPRLQIASAWRAKQWRS
jgi:hypothetical protein